MKLSQPMKKNDDLNLDLTMQIDLNDEIVESDPETRMQQIPLSL